MEQHPILKNFLSSPKSMLMIGSLVLLISLALVHFWIQSFFIFAIEFPPSGTDVTNLCDWQYSLSNEYTWSGNGNTGTPFLMLFHISAFLFIFRWWRRKQSPFILLLEFGALNVLFVFAGVALFILIALINIPILPISNILLGCKPTFLALPGIVTTSLVALGLIYSQATGWLSRRITLLAPTIQLNDEATPAEKEGNYFMGSGSILLLLLILILLHTWFVLFFAYAIQLPESGMWACWGTGCEKTAWQSDVSQYFAFTPNARLKLFSLVFHIGLIIFFFRYRQNDDRVWLPLEIGVLGILFMMIGTLVFAGTIAIYKMVNYPDHRVAPIAVSESGGTLFVPALSPSDFVVKDNTGFITMNPKDDLQYIYYKIPWEINGKLRAWAGVIASTIVVIGLFLSLISGWLNKLIRNLSRRHRANLLLLMLLISGSFILMELHTFGFYLFW
jgi:hypothetical protein